jgi:hypothetical protein
VSWTVWKAELSSHTTRTIIKVPKGAELLGVSNQYDTAVIWFACNPLNPLEDREIIRCITGSEAPPPEQARFLGTVQLDRPSGYMVYHFFERRR